MSAKHTAGPWNVRKPMATGGYVVESPTVGDGYYSSIASATQRDPHPQKGGGVSHETAEANARLIAAAPDLLEALRECDSAFAGWQVGGIPGRPEDILALITKARAAIAKAEGR